MASNTVALRRGTIDLTGSHFGRLIVMGPVWVSGRTKWMSHCDCANFIIANSGDLRRGDTKSCGCFKQDRIVTHGETRNSTYTAEYRTWDGMIQRCTNPANDKWDLYGGRGILVCNRWRDDFSCFLADMGRKPSSRHSIDRINTHGNYEPGNCRWATYKEQNRNLSNSRYLTHDGLTLTLAEWTERTGLGRNTIAHRIDIEGWSIEKAITEPRHLNQWAVGRRAR